MKRDFVVSGLLGFIIVGLATCTPTSTEPLSATSVPSQNSNATASPSVTKPSIKPTSEVIPVTGPSMEVGSVHPYVDGSHLVAVVAGEFIRGEEDDDNSDHLVTLEDYWIYATEVTNQQYTLCVEMGQCTLPDLFDNLTYMDSVHANDPVVGITYDQAVDYCEFVNGRLPTETEWEKAARGPDGNIYPWGDTTPSCELLNFDDCIGETTNVVEYPDGKSYYGGLDMSGNVFEWVADWYDPDYYNRLPEDNHTGPDNGAARSVRSSSFESTIDQVKLIVRNYEDPQDHRPDLGFRCVVDDPVYFAPFCKYPLVYGLQTSISIESCPDLSIEQAQYCSNKVSTTNVIFSGPPDSVIDAGDCLPSGDPALFVCQAVEQVSITADCQLDLPQDPACPSGYSQQDDICVADGPPGQCLEGWNYDSTNQCCMIGPGQESSLDLTVCPVGTYYLASQNACLPFATQGIVSVVQDIEFMACGASGGREGEDPCPGGTWDPELNCCSTDPFCY